MHFDSQYMVGVNAMSASVEQFRAQHEESKRRLEAYKAERLAESISASENGRRAGSPLLFALRQYICRVAPKLASRLAL